MTGANMSAADALREALANAYATHADWVRAATRAGLDPSRITMQGSAFSVWSKILDALRFHHRMGGLHELVAAEQSGLLPLLEQYVAELARGEGELTDLPELAAVALIEADLDAELVVRSLAFEEALPISLLDLALAPDVPQRAAMDAALSGKRTVEARARLAQYRRQQESALAEVETRRRAAGAKAKDLCERIEGIERASPPHPPTTPEDHGLPDSSRVQAYAWYDRQKEEYRVALARHQRNQESLPGLRADMQAVSLELAQLEAAVASNKAQAAAGEPALHRAIDEARDQDLLAELGRMLSKARDAFRSEGKPFKGFWILLAASSVLDFIERVVANAAFATEARQRFTTDAEALEPLVQRGLPAVAWGCLAGPTLVARALQANGEAVDALGRRLAELPTARLVECARHARAAIVPLAEVPPHAHLEHPADIDAMARKLVALKARVMSQVTRMQAELGNGLRGDVGRVVDKAATTIEAIRATADNHAAVLARSRLLWTLIERGVMSGELPAFTRALCTALPHEFAARTGRKPGVVLRTASETVFSLKDAQAATAATELTEYTRSGEALRDAIEAAERRLADIEAAEVALTTLVDGTVRRYRVKLKWITCFSVVPGAGLFSATWALRIVGRLKPLAASGEARYVGLGRDAFGLLLVALALSGITAGIAVLAVWDAWRVIGETWLIAASACSVGAFVLFFWSAVAARPLKAAMPGGCDRRARTEDNSHQSESSDRGSASASALNPDRRMKL
jgi:flavin-binding protein dodecin